MREFYQGPERNNVLFADNTSGLREAPGKEHFSVESDIQVVLAIADHLEKEIPFAISYINHLKKSQERKKTYS